MKKVFLLTLILCNCAFFGYAQKNKEKKVYKDDSIQTIELGAILNFSPNEAYKNRFVGCLDLVTFEHRCAVESSLRYGGLRAGRDWDWLQIIMPAQARTRMVNIGGKKWEDAIRLPHIKLWSRLRPGEQRSTTVDASAGAPGGVNTKDPSGYNPFLKAFKGNMYLVRVYDDVNDYYILFRVDELKRGTTCKISWRKLDIPAEKRPPKY